MSKLFKAWAGDQTRGCITRLIATVIVVPLLLLLVIAPLIYVQNTRGLDDTTVMLVMVIPMGLFLFLIFGGGFLFLFIARKRRSNWLDSIFGEGGLGLEGRSYLYNFRQYHGQIRGRQVDVYFYRGPTLDIYVGTSLKTRFNVGEKSRIGLFLAKSMNRTPVEINEHGWEELSLFALDSGWMQRLLANAQAKTILLRLLTEESDALFRQVHLQPGGLHLKLYRNQNLFQYGLTAGQVNHWVDDLFTLAQIAENLLPAPAINDVASSLEQQNQSNRDSMTRKVSCFLVIFFSALLFIALAAIGISLLIGQSKKTRPGNYQTPQPVSSPAVRSKPSTR